MSEDLDKLLPAGLDVKLGSGETLTLQPFKFGQLPKAIKLLRPVTDAVGGAGIARFDGGNFYLAPDWPLRLPALMDEAGESLLAFVAFASGMPREFVDGLQSDDGIALTKAAFQVNGDFFIARIAPRLGMATPKIPQAGAPSSPG